MSETALYECMRKTFTPVVIHTEGPYKDSVNNKMFIPQDAEGQIPEHLYMYQVPQGELVPHHFKPVDETAKADREDQITNPEKYIETRADMGVIAEFMVDRKFYEHEQFYDKDRGTYVIRKCAKQVALESIKETIGDATYRALLDGEKNATEYKTRQDAIDAMCQLGEDDKATRKALLAIIKEANITKGFFRGAPPKTLAGFVYDQGLYKE